MFIKNTKKEEIEKALENTNKAFKGNLDFLKLEAVNTKETRFSVRLRVKDSKGDGARRSFYKNKDGARKKMISACWHSHGRFFDELLRLNPEAEIKTGDVIVSKNGGNWQDKNIGSIIKPFYFSEACEC